MISIIQVPDEFAKKILHAQQGYFTLKQGGKYGLTERAINEFTRLNVFTHEGGDVFKVKIFPEASNFDLLMIGLSTEMAATISHVSALAYHNLSQEVPYVVDVTLESKGDENKFIDLSGRFIHHGNIPDNQKIDAGGFYVTTETRTIFDCIVDGCIQHETMAELILDSSLNRHELTKEQNTALDDAIKNLSMIKLPYME